MEWSHIFSNDVKSDLLIFSFIWRYFDLAIKFFLKNWQKVLDEINVCCYCCLILLFVLTSFLNNCWSHESNVAFFTPLSYLRWRRSFSPFTFFFEKHWTICANAHNWAPLFLCEINPVDKGTEIWNFQIHYAIDEEISCKQINIMCNQFSFCV